MTVRHICRNVEASGKRHLVLSDAMSVVLAGSKGRSNSAILARRMQKIAALCLAASLQIAWRWVPSEQNAGDRASRNRPGVWGEAVAPRVCENHGPAVGDDVKDTGGATAYYNFLGRSPSESGESGVEAVSDTSSSSGGSSGESAEPSVDRNRRRNAAGLCSDSKDTVPTKARGGTRPTEVILGDGGSGALGAAGLPAEVRVVQSLVRDVSGGTGKDGEAGGYSLGTEAKREVLRRPGNCGWIRTGGSDHVHDELGSQHELSSSSKVLQSKLASRRASEVAVTASVAGRYPDHGAAAEDGVLAGGDGHTDHVRPIVAARGDTASEGYVARSTRRVRWREKRGLVVDTASVRRRSELEGQGIRRDSVRKKRCISLLWQGNELREVKGEAGRVLGANKLVTLECPVLEGPHSERSSSAGPTRPLPAEARGGITRVGGASSKSHGIKMGQRTVGTEVRKGSEAPAAAQLTAVGSTRARRDTGVPDWKAPHIWLERIATSGLRSLVRIWAFFECMAQRRPHQARAHF